MAGRPGSEPGSMEGDQSEPHERVEPAASPGYDWIGRPFTAVSDAVFAVATRRDRDASGHEPQSADASAN